MKLEESAASIYFIRLFFFFFSLCEVQSPDSARLPNVSKHPPEPILPEYVTPMRKYFQKEKSKLISFSKIRSRRASVTHWRRSHVSAFIKDVMFDLRRSCDADESRGIKEDINVTEVGRRGHIIAE